MSAHLSDFRQQFLEQFAALSDWRSGSLVSSYRNRGKPTCRYGGSRTAVMRTVNEWCHRHRHDEVPNEWVPLASVLRRHGNYCGLRGDSARP